MSPPMSLGFLKMNGLGNDFVVVQGADDFQPTPEQVRAWGSRDTGVGFDQLIAISRDGGHSPLVRFWNNDGDEVGACGNGSRCVGWLLMQASGKGEAGFHTAERALFAANAGDNRVSVDMGEPRLKWDEIPLAEDMDTRNIELQIGPIDHPRLHTPGAVSMGNPHVVFFVDHEPSDSLIEHHPLFPQAVNVGFAHILGPDRIRLRVWERGAGLTLACGTGACAALVAAARRGLTGRSATLLLDGGELQVEWRDDNHVIMTGPVAVEFSGTLP